VLSDNIPLIERSHAFQGLLTMVTQNPTLLIGNKTNAHIFLTSCGAWAGCFLVGDQHEDYSSISSEFEFLALGLQRVLVGLRNHNETMWNRIILVLDERPRYAVEQFLVWRSDAIIH
jgi:hypothetical protein